MLNNSPTGIDPRWTIYQESTTVYSQGINISNACSLMFITHTHCTLLQPPPTLPPTT